MQSGYDEKNYEGGKEGVVDPSRDAYGYTEPIGEDVEVREEETKRELKPRYVLFIVPVYKGGSFH